MGVGASAHPWVPPFATYVTCSKEYSTDEWIRGERLSGSCNLVQVQEPNLDSLQRALNIQILGPELRYGDGKVLNIQPRPTLEPAFTHRVPYSNSIKDSSKSIHISLWKIFHLFQYKNQLFLFYTTTFSKHPLPIIYFRRYFNKYSFFIHFLVFSLMVIFFNLNLYFKQTTKIDGSGNGAICVEVLVVGPPKQWLW